MYKILSAVESMKIMVDITILESVADLICVHLECAVQKAQVLEHARFG